MRIKSDPVKYSTMWYVICLEEGLPGNIRVTNIPDDLWEEIDFKHDYQVSLLFYFYELSWGGGVLLCSPGCPGIKCVGQASPASDV